MTIHSIGYIEFNTHSVTISKDDSCSRIYCFKSNDHRCDIESFTSEDQAADYILEPFPVLVYRLVLDGETDSEN